MSFRLIIVVCIVLFSVNSGCRKEEMQAVDCEKLKQAILAGDPYETESELNKILAKQPAGPDSDENFTRLAGAISGQCSVTVTALCHNCIKTNPVESEIKLTISHAGLQKEKIIDLAFADDNRYVVVGMHD